jgi:hypothetical protein
MGTTDSMRSLEAKQSARARGSPGTLAPSPRREWLAQALLFAVAALLALQFTNLHVAMNDVYAPGSLRSLIQRTAVTPFQYRILVPAVIEWIHGRELAPRLGLEPEDTAVLLECLCVLGIYFGMRALLMDFGLGALASSAAALAVFYSLPFNFLLARHHPLWFVWDVPSVLFFTLGLHLLYRGRWAVYYALFALASLNKDTTIFLALVQLLTGLGVQSKRSVWLHFAGQLALWCAMKFVLYRCYLENPGWGAMPNMLLSNLRSLQEPVLLLLTASSFGFLWIPVVALQHRVRETFIRRSIWVLVPFALAAARVGIVFELRIWGELTPVVLLGFFGVLRGCLAPRAQGPQAHGNDARQLG